MTPSPPPGRSSSPPESAGTASISGNRSRSSATARTGSQHEGETRVKTDLNGRTAVITGGARGIGLTVARSLAADGAKIALLDLLDNVEAAAKQIADEYRVESLGQRLVVINETATT